ncbi:cytochrome c oxidase assembly protein [Emcibacter sp. SYSU 3D8]|uniref:cytochrome c oxidase assembly protein n=1 Tax=Emcibacter sp. SYSU 3D8 TaxID=3133969 RepID=UPI0031FF42B9
MSGASDGHAAGRHRRTVIVLSGVVLGMIALTAASVPLYRIFCQVTGYDGTPQRAEVIPDQTFDREVKVRFNADTDPNLPWRFRPEQHFVDVKVGENKLVFYSAENNSGQPVTGQAVFNVTPAKAGAYFTKVECFCFTEQTLQAGQKVDMPVSFFIDPAFMDDANMKDVTSITLSYTFYNQNQEAGGKTAAVQ